MGKSGEFREEMEYYFSRFQSRLDELSNRCDNLEKENKELKNLVKSCVAILSQKSNLVNKENAINNIDEFQEKRNLEEKFQNNSGPSLPGNVLS